VRVRTLPLEPDVFLAQQSGAAEAVELLEPYVALAAQRGLREVLLLHGEALILTNRAEEVETGLRPHAELGTTSREVWVQLASVAARHGQAALARRWLAADAALPAASVTTELRIQRAVAWQAVADVADDASARQNSRTLINEVPDSAGLGPADWERVGQVREGNGDRDLAEQAYREALRGSPRPLVATNNLALLLAATGRAQEALPLAEHAVTQRGDVAAYRDTLATVHMALGNAEAALAEHELCHRLEPAEPTWALHIVQTLVSLDRREAARKRLTVFEAQLGIKNLPAAQQAPWKALADALGE
jgi:tetratricopeptide (TPR) repeat protein